MEFQQIGEGVRIGIEGDDVVIRCKKDGNFGLTSSQKNINVASSEGFKGVPGLQGVKFQLNVVRKP